MLSLCRQTQTDGPMDNGKTIFPPPPIFRHGGIKKMWEKEKLYQ